MDNERKNKETQRLDQEIHHLNSNHSTRKIREIKQKKTINEIVKRKVFRIEYDFTGWKTQLVLSGMDENSPYLGMAHCHEILDHLQQKKKTDFIVLQKEKHSFHTKDQDAKRLWSFQQQDWKLMFSKFQRKVISNIDLSSVNKDTFRCSCFKNVSFMHPFSQSYWHMCSIKTRV